MPSDLLRDAPSAADLLYSDLNDELAATRKTLERFPEGKGDWRPHEKSRTIGELAAHVAQLPGIGIAILESDGLDAAQRPPLPKVNTAAELLAIFDGVAGRLRQAVASTDFAVLEQPWTLRRGDTVFFTRPKRPLMRSVLINHLIHHRAQLGVYYRLLGVPVPSIYGPTADEQF
ncbi:MAG TPA: DinB family protein [Gemmatimonadaceae bacterium]|jgi:uncharacterized damage-inducible protein DinB